MSISHHDTRLIVRQLEAGDESLSFVLRHLFERDQLGQIDTLLLFLRRKFASEEAITKEQGYPLLQQHRSAHLELSERLLKLGAFVRCAKVGPDTMSLFVRRETVGHVENFDLPLLDWLKRPREEDPSRVN